uniref:Uncharacterized protein n=1 Tax=Pipistrellus kuhlii TaxID=59472 RepID=A0A7J7YXL2_PIPKU|nr:hypothetical protein mPipKuh1_009937 [Pipistrellus kuhlii]
MEGATCACLCGREVTTESEHSPGYKQLQSKTANDTSDGPHEALQQITRIRHPRPLHRVACLIHYVSGFIQIVLGTVSPTFCFLNCLNKYNSHLPIFVCSQNCANIMTINFKIFSSSQKEKPSVIPLCPTGLGSN